MSFMDEIRQGRQHAIADQTVEHQRLVKISQRIIRDDIGINYRDRLRAILKDGAKKLFANKGMIDVFRPEHTVRLKDSISECDTETIRQYLESEWRIAFDVFDRDIGGTNRHKECHSAQGVDATPHL